MNGRKYFLQIAASGALAAAVPAGADTNFGIFDARTLGMGGAAVATASNDNAQFYNPALLAFNSEWEEKTRDARFWFPMVIPRVSESVIELEQVYQDDTYGALSAAVADFNVTPDAANAQLAANEVANLQASMDELDGAPLFADVYAGLALSEPSRLQGGGFFLGARVIAGGATTITDADRATLAAYSEGLAFVASGGAQGAPRPEIFDANGALIDPAANLDSSFDATGASIFEAGVAMSKQFELFGLDLAGGAAAKVLDVEVFEDSDLLGEARVADGENSKSFLSFNMDLGLAKRWEKFTVAFAVKDALPKNYETENGSRVRLRPRPRLGLGYRLGPVQLALDADLKPNQALGSEPSTQEAAFGAEWGPMSWLNLRAGYNYDRKGNRDDLITVGAGTQYRRFALDLAYATSGDAQAAAFQFGLIF